MYGLFLHPLHDLWQSWKVSCHVQELYPILEYTLCICLGECEERQNITGINFGNTPGPCLFIVSFWRSLWPSVYDFPAVFRHFLLIWVLHVFLNGRCFVGVGFYDTFLWSEYYGESWKWCCNLLEKGTNQGLSCICIIESCILFFVFIRHFTVRLYIVDNNFILLHNYVNVSSYYCNA